GETADPLAALADSNAALMSSVPSSDLTRKELRAPPVELKDERHNGKYAYWIGDEGTRARVDIGKPAANNTNVHTRTPSSIFPAEPRFEHIDPENSDAWEGFDSVNKQTLASMATAGLAAGTGSESPQEEFAKHYFNDLTTGGFGLPVNVRDGGMKTD